MSTASTIKIPPLKYEPSELSQLGSELGIGNSLQTGARIAGAGALAPTVLGGAGLIGAGEAAEGGAAEGAAAGAAGGGAAGAAEGGATGSLTGTAATLGVAALLKQWASGNLLKGVVYAVLIALGMGLIVYGLSRLARGRRRPVPDVGAPFDYRTPQPPETPAQIDSQLDMFLRQRDVLGLEELYLRRLLDGAADSKQITFGGGALPGVHADRQRAGAVRRRRDPQLLCRPTERGVRRLGRSVHRLHRQPGDVEMVIPESYTGFSVAVSNVVAAGPALSPITVIRTYVPPVAFNCGELTQTAISIADTLTAAGAANAPLAGAGSRRSRPRAPASTRSPSPRRSPARSPTPTSPTSRSSTAPPRSARSPPAPDP